MRAAWEAQEAADAASQAKKSGYEINNGWMDGCVQFVESLSWGPPQIYSIPTFSLSHTYKHTHLSVQHASVSTCMCIHSANRFTVKSAMGLAAKMASRGSSYGAAAAAEYVDGRKWEVEVGAVVTVLYVREGGCGVFDGWMGRRL